MFAVLPGSRTPGEPPSQGPIHETIVQRKSTEMANVKPVCEKNAQKSFLLRIRTCILQVLQWLCEDFTNNAELRLPPLERERERGRESCLHLQETQLPLLLGQRAPYRSHLPKDLLSCTKGE